MATQDDTVRRVEGDRQLAAAQEAAKARPQDAAAQRALGAALRQLWRFETALPVLEEALRLDPASWETLTEVILALRGLGRDEDAAAHAERLARSAPTIAYAQFVAGSAFKSAWRYDEALTALDAAVSLAPGQSELCQVHSVRAETLRDLERYPEAMEAYRTALTVDPKDARVWCGLASLHGDLGHRGDEADAYTEALRVAPESPSVHYAIGTAQWKYGNPAGAIRAWLEAVRVDPEYVSGHERLTVAFHRVGNAALSRRHLEEVRRLDAEWADELEQNLSHPQ